MFSLASFKKMANNFKKNWFSDYEDIDKVPSDLIEDAYWRIVENADECVQVHYGSDLDVSIYGSGFPSEPEDLKNASGIIIF